MKVFEILQSVDSVTEETLISRLKGFDWKYEFSEDTRRQSRGHLAMNVLENQVYKFWKQNPARAVELWNQFAPGYKGNVTPSFILRLENQDR